MGLYPGNYYLRFTSLGYQTTWYPGVKGPSTTVVATAPAGAKLVNAVPQQATKAAALPIVGFPATISGHVDAGQVATPVRITIFTAIVTSVFAGLIPLASIAALANAGTLAAFVAVCAAMLALRRREPETEKRQIAFDEGAQDRLVRLVRLPVDSIRVDALFQVVIASDLEAGDAEHR